MSMIKAVIVDFDDTLCLTEEACFYLENEVLRRIGAKPFERALHISTWGQPLFEAIKVRSPGVDVAAFRETMAQAQLEWVDEGKIDVITPANLAAIDALLADGKEVFVLTARTHEEVVHFLEPEHDLSKRIKQLYYRDVMLFHKPDPRAFDTLLSDHILKPSECVYVGDSLTDAEAAKGAGMHFVACLEAGIRTRADFSIHPVDAFIDRFADLPATVALLGTEAASPSLS